MRVETKKEMREVEVRVYYSDDGEQFDTEYDCRRYEEDLKRESKLDKLEPYIAKKLEDQIPLHADDYYSSSMYYTWFKANNKEEYETICDLLDKRFGEPNGFSGPDAYPYYFCVETEREFEGEFEDYYTTLDMCKNAAKNFFDRFGIKVEFQIK